AGLAEQWPFRERSERVRLTRERVARPVQLDHAPALVADELEQLAALAAGNRPVPVVADLLEDRRRRAGALRRSALEPPLAPPELELRALRPPRPERVLEPGRHRLARAPRRGVGRRGVQSR